jgi:hypothetical protein
MKQRWAVKPPPPFNEHEAAYIEHGRMKAWVDRKVCRLVLACWKRGWETEMSCEGIFPGVAQICFQRHSFLLGFMKAIDQAKIEPVEIERIIQSGVLDAGYMRVCGFRRDGKAAWVSENNNCALFPLAYVPSFQDVVQRS